MKLVSNWRAVLRYAWTVRVGIILAVVNAVYVTVAIITASLPVPPIWLAVLNGGLALAIPLLRLIPQPSIAGEEIDAPE